MLELTECLGADVVDAAGEQLGALVDLAARLEDPYPLVTRVRVRTERRSFHFLPWEAVETLSDRSVKLSASAQDLRSASDQTGTLRPEELLLGAHVLDSQIVDVNARRVARVGEVELLEDGELRVVGVEVGRAALLRRLGMRRLSRRFERELIDWRDLHIASGRGHTLQLRTTASRVHRLHATELAHLVTRMPLGHGADVLRAVHPRPAAEALGAAHPELAGRLLSQLDPREAAPVLDQMDDDDAASAMRHMGEDQRAQLLAALPAQRAQELERWLARPAEAVAAPSPVRGKFRKVLSARRRAPS